MIWNAAKIYSTLGNPNSLWPLGVKDGSSCLGMTAGSYITGKKEESVDRFIDEFGTEALWLGGIPAFKWLFDKIVFKSFNLDSKIDPRNFKDKEIFEKIKEYAPTDDIKKNLEKAGMQKKLFKNLAASKFVVSTVLAAVSYVGLTRLKQYYTKQQIRKNLIQEYNENKNKKEEKQSQNPSFKGIGRVVEEFAFSPVKNMYIMDGFITTERLTDSRNPQEFAGYAIKEGSCLFFLYYAGKKIQQWMENSAKKKHNKSITLDSRILEDEGFKKTFDDGSVEKAMKDFKNGYSTKLELYEFLHKHPENQIVKLAKQADIIKTMKGTDKIDTRAFIDLKDVEGMHSQVDELYNQYKDALAKGETSEQFFNGVKKLKRMSIIKNIGACVLALGVITPAAMVIKRLTDKDGKEFQTKKEIKEQLIKEGIIS